MKKHPLSILVAVAMATPAVAVASSVKVHSAAGILPGQAATVTQEDNTRTLITASTTEPPPLPGHDAAANTTPATDYAASQPTHSDTPPVKPEPVPFVTFDKAMDQSVTIDVVDIKLEDLLDDLSPAGWRVRIQDVAPSVLAQRVDLTAVSTRREVLHKLLAQANLTLKPFEGLDTPLILITSR